MSNISDLYKQYLGREARPDELEFHEKHGSIKAGRLKPWLRQQKISSLEKETEQGADELAKRSLGTYDLEDKLLKRLREDKGLKESRRKYYTAPETLREREDWGDMTPQQRRSLEAQAQTGALEDVRAQGGALKDILGTVSKGYEKSTEQFKLGQEAKAGLLDRLLGEVSAEQEAEQQAFENELALQELALQQAALAQKGGGSRSSGGRGAGEIKTIDDQLAQAGIARIRKEGGGFDFMDIEGNPLTAEDASAASGLFLQELLSGSQAGQDIDLVRETIQGLREKALGKKGDFTVGEEGFSTTDLVAEATRRRLQEQNQRLGEW